MLTHNKRRTTHDGCQPIAKGHLRNSGDLKRSSVICQRGEYKCGGPSSDLVSPFPFISCRALNVFNSLLTFNISRLGK